MMIRLRVLDFLGKTKINRWYRFLKKSEYWSEGEIIEHQRSELAKLVQHCYQNVPYYKTLFDNLGLKPSDIKSLEDLAKIPIVRKSDILKNPDLFIAKNYMSYQPVKSKTGGSTGVPMDYYSDRRLKSIDWAYKFMTWGWGGYTIGDKMGVLGGGALFVDSKVTLKQKVRNSLNAFHKFPMTSFSTEKIDVYARTITSKRIKFLRGYPSAIAAYADHLKGSKSTIKSVFPTAEILTPEYREKIEKGINAEVFDQYGCGDAGAIACECEAHKGLHVLDQAVITEIIKDGEKVKDGDQGELVFTSLYRYAMPFLRYAPEDWGIKAIEACPCGRKTTLLSEISGRTSDIITFANGNSIAGPALTLIFSRVNVEKYQLIQESLNELDVLIIPNVNFTDEDESRVRFSMIKHSGEGVNINIKKVKEIPLSKSGKFRHAISKIKQ